MINGSFVFGMDEDDPDVFDRTVDWAIEQSIKTATFHVLTPYPGTGLYERMRSENRSLQAIGVSMTRGITSFVPAD